MGHWAGLRERIDFGAGGLDGGQCIAFIPSPDCIAAVEAASASLGSAASAEAIAADATARLREACAATPASAGLFETGLVETIVRCRGLCVTPVCAIVGGQWGQEVIRAITGRSPPAGNLFITDARKHPAGQFGWLPEEPAVRIAGSASTLSSSSASGATVTAMAHAAEMGNAIELSDDEDDER